MNQANEASKSRVLKTFAVVGFVVLIIVAFWLAIQIVQLIPSTFSSLASLAESVEDGRQAQNEIVIEDSAGVVNAGESFTITWSDLDRDGAYVLSYDCVDGVSLDVRIDTEITSVACGTNFILPQDTYTLDARFTSEKDRFTDVPYTISFIREGESEEFTRSTQVASIVNATIPDFPT
ncbi:MAG: hypothetical protein AAFO91_01800, partial [Bacteroidota bacterium]